MDQQLRDAIYGNKPVTPGPSNDATVNQAYAASFRAPLVSAISNAQVNESAMRLDEAEKAAAAEAKRKEALSDPKNFQRIPKTDGGFAFYDPSGKEITAYDYARVVGTTVDKVLADSENPLDKGFRSDYKNLQDYFTAWQNGDSKRVKSIQDAAPMLRSITDPQDLIRRFQQAYPTVYGRGGFNGPGTAGQGIGSTFIPRYYANNDEYGVDNESIIGD